MNQNNPDPFPEYGVAGVGTVIAHESGFYHVRHEDGRVCGYPALSGEPSEQNAAADIAAAIANPVLPVAAQIQDARVVLSRLTNAETSAIFGSVDPVVIRIRSMALAVGAVSSADADAAAGFAYLVAQGLLAPDRPAQLLAP